MKYCMIASSSKDVGAIGATVPFSVELILIELEGRRYVGPLLSVIMTYLVSGRRGNGISSSVDSVNRSGSGGGSSRGGRSNGGGGNGGSSGGAVQSDAGTGTGGVGGAARVQVHYEAYLPALSLWDKEQSHTILAGMFLLDRVQDSLRNKSS